MSFTHSFHFKIPDKFQMFPNFHGPGFSTLFSVNTLKKVTLLNIIVANRQFDSHFKCSVSIQSVLSHCCSVTSQIETCYMVSYARVEKSIFNQIFWSLNYLLRPIFKRLLSIDVIHLRWEHWMYKTNRFLYPLQ